MRQVLFLYNIIIIILTPFAFIAGYIITKSKGGEKGFGQRFGLIRLKGGARSKSVWFHCASVGEVRSIANITAAIREKYPDTAIIVSTMTVTGRNEAEKTIKADECFLLPIENGAAISYLIKLLGVKAFFIVDTEIWPNLIYTAGSNTRLIMINGKVSEKSFKSYMKFRFFIRPLFKKFAAILTKSQGDLERFIKITGRDNNIAQLGNIKFQKRKSIEEVGRLEDFTNIKYAFAASTHEGEEQVIIEGFKIGGNGYDKLIIAPRHIKRGEDIKKLCIDSGLSCSLYSESYSGSRVIIIDSFGLLEKFYIGGYKIFIGGSIVDIGGHNIYEALQFGKRIATGVHMQDFEEIYIPAKEFNLIDNVTTAQDVACWLTADEKDGDFHNFFIKIDEGNARVITVIEDLIDDVLATETLTVAVE